MDALDRLSPPLRTGERVSLRLAGTPAREALGFVVEVGPDALALVDRRGAVTRHARADVQAARRGGVALGRDPLRTPQAELDALAARAGASGEAWVARLSDLLAGRTPPAEVPAWGGSAEFDGVRARHEGEWVTLADAGVDAAVAAGWWATRQGARSVQVRTDDPEVAAALAAAGFTCRRPA